MHILDVLYVKPPKIISKLFAGKPKSFRVSFPNMAQIEGRTECDYVVLNTEGFAFDKTALKEAAALFLELAEYLDEEKEV